MWYSDPSHSYPRGSDETVINGLCTSKLYKQVPCLPVYSLFYSYDTRINRHDYSTTPEHLTMSTAGDMVEAYYAVKGMWHTFKLLGAVVTFNGAKMNRASAEVSLARTHCNV